MDTRDFDDRGKILCHEFTDRDQHLLGREAGGNRRADQVLQVGLDDVAAIFEPLVRDRDTVQFFHHLTLSESAGGCRQ